MRRFSIIVAATQKDHGIGFGNTIPWRIGKDMDEFKRITMDCKEGYQNAVIMGRKTWESIPKKFRPLPGRLNIVISSTLPPVQNIYVANSFAMAFGELNAHGNVDKVFLIGGVSLYAEGLQSSFCESIYLTTIFADFVCDKFLPPIDPSLFELCRTGAIQQENGISFQFLEYAKRHDEYQYLDAVENVLITGKRKPNRTLVDTLSRFGHMMKFSLRDNVIPLLTTREVFWPGIVKELLWIISGSTDAKELSSKRVKIWDDNAGRKALDKLGFTDREVGDLGPIYGHQWRHFGSEYIDCKTDYTGQGVDQLRDAIDLLKSNPNDRRMLVCAWNAKDLPKMALPPCHVLFQFYIYNKELSCTMYQRSCDLGLGAPFNIASYSLLTLIIAQLCDLTPGDFVYQVADMHVYVNHKEALETQLLRDPFPFPRVKINPDKKDIDDFVFEDFELIGYESHPKIKMQMAV